MTLTQRQAEAALEAIIARFSWAIDPQYGMTGPKLLDRDGRWEIVWEEGPSEWALQASYGGLDEGDYLVADLTGWTPDPKPPVVFPAGIGAEPYNSFTLTLYRQEG